MYPQYRIPNPIRIISDKDRKRLFDYIPNEGQCNMTDMDKERTRDIQGISRVAIESYDVALKAAIEFEDALLKDGRIDFISMVKLAVKLIQNESYVRKSLEARFPWVIVDEYQDLGKPLHEIVLALLDLTNIKVFAVGDGDQSIYDFQGAAPDFSPTGAPGTWHFNTARATEFVWQRTTTAAPHRWVNHLQRTTHWTRNFNNQTGWNVNRVGTWAPNVVHTTLGSSPGTNPSTQARTNSNLNLRATARLTGNLLATIPNGSLVTLLGASTNADGEHWTNISWNGHRGWSVTRGLNFFA